MILFQAHHEILIFGFTIQQHYRHSSLALVIVILFSPPVTSYRFLELPHAYLFRIFLISQIR